MERRCWVSGVVLVEFVKPKRCQPLSLLLLMLDHDMCSYLLSLYSEYSIDPQACDCIYNLPKDLVFRLVERHFAK